MASRPQVEKVVEHRIRRRAQRRGLAFGKSHGSEAWFLYDHANRADTARVFYSLSDAERGLDDETKERESQPSPDAVTCGTMNSTTNNCIRT